MGSDDDIAEERLLRVIEKGERGGSSASSAAHPDARGFLSRMRSFLARFYSRPVKKDDRVLLMLQRVGLVLWIVLAGAGVYLAYGLVSFQTVTLKRAASYSSDGIPYAPAVELPPFSMEEKLKPVDQYLNTIRQRDPFTGTSSVQEEVVEGPREPTPQETLQSMAQGLTVVGINRGAVPDAIIEDTAAKRTFFVKAGDKIKELTVKEIRHDTVVLTYQGEELEIG